MLLRRWHKGRIVNDQGSDRSNEPNLPSCQTGPCCQFIEKPHAEIGPARIVSFNEGGEIVKISPGSFKGAMDSPRRRDDLAVVVGGETRD
jgi:hypothetical protein